MMRRPPISPRTDTLFPYTTLFRSAHPRPAGAMSGDAALRDWTIDALEKLRREAARSADTHLLRLEFDGFPGIGFYFRSEEHTSELQSLMRISYAVFCLKKKKKRPLYY